MKAVQPQAAVWLDIPRSSHLRATFTGDGDIHVMFGDPNDEVNVVFERSALARLVEVANELLAVPESMILAIDRTAIRKPAS